MAQLDGEDPRGPTSTLSPSTLKQHNDNARSHKAFEGFRWNCLSSLQDSPYHRRAEAFLASTDWRALMAYATNQRNGIACSIRPDIGLGGNHMVRILEFADGTLWVARLRLPPLEALPPSSNGRMACEVHTISLLRKRTELPIPRIHGYETRSDCTIKASFMLMDCLRGNVGMDLGMDVPQAFRHTFLKDLAKLHVELSTVRLPQIGTIIAVNADGSCQQGPIPGLGGPFNTATDYFKAWAANAEFGLSEERLKEVCGSYAAEIIPMVSSFPGSVGHLAERLSAFDKGPFPLCHGDFGHNNIVVDDDYRVLGVIDWESAFAAPWEIFADFPLHLTLVPPAMDAPWNYNEDGSPVDDAIAQKMADQDEYVAAVALEEERIGAEPMLSRALRDKKRQQLATGMRLYEGGKAGFYDKLIQQFG